MSLVSDVEMGGMEELDYEREDANEDVNENNVEDEAYSATSDLLNSEGPQNPQSNVKSTKFDEHLGNVRHKIERYKNEIENSLNEDKGIGVDIRNSGQPPVDRLYLSLEKRLEQMNTEAFYRETSLDRKGGRIYNERNNDHKSPIIPKIIINNEVDEEMAKEDKRLEELEGMRERERDIENIESTQNMENIDPTQNIELTTESTLEKMRYNELRERIEEEEQSILEQLTPSRNNIDISGNIYKNLPPQSRLYPRELPLLHHVPLTTREQISTLPANPKPPLSDRRFTHPKGKGNSNSIDLTSPVRYELGNNSKQKIKYTPSRNIPTPLKICSLRTPKAIYLPPQEDAFNQYMTTELNKNIIKKIYKATGGEDIYMKNDRRNERRNDRRNDSRYSQYSSQYNQYSQDNQHSQDSTLLGISHIPIPPGKLPTELPHHIYTDQNTSAYNTLDTHSYALPFKPPTSTLLSNNQHVSHLSKLTPRATTTSTASRVIPRDSEQSRINLDNAEVSIHKVIYIYIYILYIIEIWRIRK